MEVSVNIKKKIILISTLVDSFILGGPAYGWPSLVFVLRDRGYFSDLCVNSDQANSGNNSSFDQNIESRYPTCTEQDARLQLVFIIGIFGHQSGALIFGFIYDKFGTRIARIISSTLILLACLIFAFSGPSTSNLTFIALHLLATGSSNLIVTNIQVGNIFGNRRSTVIGLISGACGSSAVIMVFIQIAYNAGISMMASFSFLAGLTVFFTINTVLLPKYKFPWPVPTDLENRMQVATMYGGTNANEFNASGSDPATISKNDTLWVDVNYKTRLSCLSSPMYLLFLMWFSIIQLIHLFYLGTVNPRLQQLTGDSTEAISTYSSIYTVLYSTIIAFAWLCGAVVDRNKIKVSKVRNNDSNNQIHRIRSHFDDLQDFIPALIITNLVTAFFNVCSMIPILKLQILTFILQVMGRTFLYVIIAAFLALAFPAKYCGSVFGICSFVSAWISLLQYPLLKMVQNVFDDNFLYTFYSKAISLVSTLALSVNVFFTISSMEVSVHIKKKIILISTLVESFILGGPAYGWPSLVFVLRDRGYFSDLCVNSEQVTYIGNNSSSDQNIDSGYPTCTEQDARLQLVFIIGIFGHNSGALIFGFIYDKFGYRIARIISSILILLACLLFAFSGPSTSNLTFIALHLLATGSSNLIVTNTQVGNIFGNRRSTVIGLISGACGSSAVIMVFIQIAYNAGISMMASFSFLAGLTVFFTINTVLLPKYKFPWPVPTDLENRMQVATMYGGTNANQFNASGSDPATTSNNDTLWVDVEYKTRLSCLSSPMFLLFLMWFSIIQLIHLFYLGTVNPRLQQLTGNSTEAISTYSSIYTVLYSTIIVFAWLCGAVVDRNKNKVSKVRNNDSNNQSHRIRSHFNDLQDFIPALIITNLATAFFNVCSMIPILKLQILTFILQVMGRTFLYVIIAAFLALAFGSVYGICRIVAACISLLQYPLLQMVQNVFADNFLYIDLLLVLLNVCSLSLPVYVYYFVLKKEHA
ncbi:uncharacterized protein [Antedon mediterranea]|uniref:uncharacterized protein n=1 Tax=Antedon mediterranea TaxID=105859 RepID=UPI003AF5632F